MRDDPDFGYVFCPPSPDLDNHGVGDACDPSDDGDDERQRTAFRTECRATSRNNRDALGPRDNDNVLTFASTNKSVFTTADTGGYSRARNIAELGLGQGHTLLFF